MKIALTGGNGFVGRDFSKLLLKKGCEVSSVVRVIRPGNEHVIQNVGDLADRSALEKTFSGCDAVVHCAGINREVGRHTFQRVHVEGTRNVIDACRESGVRRLVFVSFLKARPSTTSTYHQSKWEAEQLCTNSQLDFVVLKPGVIYGKGDHMIAHMSRALRISPVFGLIGGDVDLRPIALTDFSQTLFAACIDDRLRRTSNAVLGPEQLKLSEAARRVAAAMHRPVIPIVIPAALGYALAAVFEKTMREPLLAVSQITMISEGLADALPGEQQLPADLQPQLPFSGALIKEAL